MAQSVERRIGSAEVTGPIPVSSFFYALRAGGVLKRGTPLFTLRNCLFLHHKSGGEGDKGTEPRKLPVLLRQ